MPLGLYTSCEVSAPCGLCSTEGIIGLLDVPDTFLDPDRMKAGLIWFTRGFIEYQFPNNAKLANNEIESMEFSMELSSEVPGTSADWPSDITVAVNGKDIGTWTSPGRFRRQARRLYARLVEAQGQPVRQAEELARRPRRHLCRRHQDLAGLAQGSRPRQPPLDPPARSGSRRTPSIPAASTSSAAASAITTRTSSCGSTSPADPWPLMPADGAKVADGTLSVSLPPYSWQMIRVNLA